ncbi:MAG TPA: NAD(P)/FAD-dependent oxidoreductase [Acidobacteriaceae bacterium]|jgi:phytoene dehydrogenase-like protein|nr:NAD(P)/FAD-dependent oxidoreductase [Acidobacteriaceae bacterium]
MDARKKIVIIGGGIGGLSAAVYALRCGYAVELLEMNSQAGGLAMSWERGSYTFETCLHWLVGSRPGADLHDHWRELLDIDKLTFIDPEIFVRMETERGDDGLTIYTNVDRLEMALLKRAPQDTAAILEFTDAVRSLSHFRMIDPSEGLAENWWPLLQDLPRLPLLRRLSRMSGKDYGRRFSDPLLRRFFSDGDIGRMSVIAIILSLTWMHMGNAGYCLGGSQALIRGIEATLRRLGGTLRFGTKAEKILVENDRAVGVELAGGERVRADWVISAADGHATLFQLLGARYLPEALRVRYATKPLFASYVQVSLGVALDLHDQPPMLSLQLEEPLVVEPGNGLDYASFRFFHFDPTFAPAGKTAATCLLPTRNYRYWSDLRANDPPQYHAEKHRVAEAVLSILERRIPGVRAAIEVLDVSTPATVLRYTGNWQGTMEGWLVEPGDQWRSLPNTLPGLERFLMVGQWVAPGGGLPSGPMTARPAVKAICRADHVPFTPHAEPVAELVGV